MPSIHAVDLPAGALLARLRGEGAYTDCYATDIAAQVTQASYIEAFYTTPPFKLERLLLA